MLFIDAIFGAIWYCLGIYCPGFKSKCPGFSTYKSCISKLRDKSQKNLIFRYVKFYDIYMIQVCQISHMFTTHALAVTQVINVHMRSKYFLYSYCIINIQQGRQSKYNTIFSRKASVTTQWHRNSSFPRGGNEPTKLCHAGLYRVEEGALLLRKQHIG